MSPELRDLRKTCALAMYKANASRTEIMDLLGCGHDSVRQWARSADLPAKMRFAERDQAAIDLALSIYHAEIVALQSQQDAEAKRQAEAKRMAKLEAKQRKAKLAAEARAAEAKARSKNVQRGYVCQANCACLLCQLAEPDDSSRRTDVFAVRLDLG